MSKPFGLVVCGGKSSRMGTDKSMINYHGRPQMYHLYDMLMPLCEHVFISCNEQQAPLIPDKYAVIVDEDEYKGIGPMAALLSAHNAHPNHSFLVVGCDYVYICAMELQRLIEVSLQLKNTVSLTSNSNSIKEPLLSHYQSFTLAYLQSKFKQKMYSVRRTLDELETAVIFPADEKVLKSIDNVYDREIALFELQNKQ